VWASGPVWTGAENLTPPGFDPRTVQPVSSRYTDYATRPTYVKCYKGKEASICYAFGFSTTLQTVMKFILPFFSFFKPEPSEGIENGDRHQNRLLFAGVGFSVIFVLILKTILFSVLKWMAEASVPRI